MQCLRPGLSHVLLGFVWKKTPPTHVRRRMTVSTTPLHRSGCKALSGCHGPVSPSHAMCGHPPLRSRDCTCLCFPGRALEGGPESPAEASWTPGARSPCLPAPRFREPWALLGLSSQRRALRGTLVRSLGSGRSGHIQGRARVHKPEDRLPPRLPRGPPWGAAWRPECPCPARAGVCMRS